MERICNRFFTGINYWDSKNAINMWRDFDPETIEKDMLLLERAGITHLRVFPLWSVFQPITALMGPGNVYEYAFGEEPLPDTPAGRAGVSEEACQSFETFCSIALSHGMKLVVALITGHMSFRTYCPPAFCGKELLTDPTVIKWQLRFVKYFVSRFKENKAIVGWDLGNETVHMPGLGGKNFDAFYVWCCAISGAIKSCDPTRPVISGLDDSSVENGFVNLKTIGEVCDIHTTHPYNIFSTAKDPINTMRPIMDLAFKCTMGRDISGVPMFVQEFGAIGYMNCSRKTEADFYRGCLLSSLAHGCGGTMWWCAFDQGHLDYAPYRWNSIGSDYGFFDKNLEEKPLVSQNREFAHILESLPEGNLPPLSTQGVIVIPREESNQTELLRTTYLLAKRANLDMNFCYATDKIPKAPLYIIPSVSGNKSMPKNRLEELLNHVAEGAVLYICADTGLMRQIPEITGVEIECREYVGQRKSLVLNGKELPIDTKYFYKARPLKAEVVARDENGEAVFFRNKYKKGLVYFLTLPLEASLTAENGVFYKENIPPYDMVYRRVAKESSTEKICDCDNKFICITQHVTNRGQVYIFAINYNNKPESTFLLIKDGYKIDKTIFGNPPHNLSLELEENQGVLLVVKKLP